MVFPANDKPSEIMQPVEQALDFPSATVAPQYTAVLCPALFQVLLVRCDKLGSILLQKAFIKWIAIVRSITNYSLRRFFDKPTFDSAFNQLHFVG